MECLVGTAVAIIAAVTSMARVCDLTVSPREICALLLVEILSSP